jgi:SAM-dependent methyltransferase
MTSSISAGYSSKVSEYVSGRPEYPGALLSDLPPANTIIDLGAGTGKFTELLALTGKRILAVEPIEKMATRIPVDRLKAVEVLIGSAELIPVPDQVADLVCCATAFHWFDYVKATREILRVLKVDGALALIWNVRDDRVPWVAKFSSIMDTYASDTPRQSTGKWRIIFDDVRFRHLSSRSYHFSQPMPASGIVDRALSTSFITVLPEEEQNILRTKIESLIERDSLLSNRDVIEFPYVTETAFVRKGALSFCRAEVGICAAGSTGRCNTFRELVCWGLI